jgi:HD-like signal output (HDOD) protein
MHSRWYTPDFNKVTIEFEHLFQCGMKACSPAQKKLVSSVCSQEERACFMSTSVRNCLLAWCFFRCPVRQKSLDPALPTRLVTSYSTMDLAICKRHWHGASYNLLQKPDTNLLHEDTGLGATVGQTLKCQWSQHESLVCTMCCHHAVRIHQNQYKVPSLIWFVTPFFEIPV